jgi:hypothetical protein|nr:MAG TPA: hypothetical protein [Caudoviricetes sp.]
MDLTGFLTINGTDVWTEYGAFLGETEEGGHVNMDALLRMPSAKDITTVDFRERVGVELPLNPDVKLNSIERTLQFFLRGTSVTDRLEKYQRMMTLITSGMLSISVKNYRTYKMVYQDMPADPSWYESYEGDRFYVLFSVKFMEPQPSI